MKAHIFPGQGSQFTGMGKDLYDQSGIAKKLFRQADEILGFSLSKVMFEGSAEELKQTKVTQPAIFLYSVLVSKLMSEDSKPNMVAGHSLGEYSALVANNALSFEDGIQLVSKRAFLMQHACEAQESTMAVILGLEDQIVEEVCKGIDGIVVAANYNCPGQIVISGATMAVEQACEMLKIKGAKRALKLAVGGAFHSPLMKEAEEALAEAINQTTFNSVNCPIYQNATTKPVIEVQEIKQNLIKQLTAPVRWTQSINQMISDGCHSFTEVGPGKVLQGLVKKINKTIEVNEAKVVLTVNE